MPDLFFIGVGGSGAKVAEALIYLAACGGVPSNRIHVLLVDPDVSNGNVERAQRALELYKTARELFKGTLFLGPELVGHERWSPFPLDDNMKVTLESLLGLGAGGTHADRALFNALFSGKQQSSRYLSGGFYGDPSVGSVVFANAAWDRGGISTFFAALEQAARQEAPVPVVIVGSAVGGTGASGVPTFALQIADKGLNARVSTVLLLPYFTYDPSGSRDDLVPDAGDFLYKTRLALEFYGSVGITSKVERMYLMGEPKDLWHRYPGRAEEGASQTNPPHYVELYAALACADAASPGVETDRGVAFIAREARERIDTGDLPLRDRWQGNMVKFARFAHCLRYSYDAFYARKPGTPAIQRRREAPWVYRYFAKEASDEFRRRYDAAVRFSSGCLLWLGSFERMSSRMQPVQKTAGLPAAAEFVEEVTAPDTGLLSFRLMDVSSPRSAGAVRAGQVLEAPMLALDVWNALCAPSESSESDRPYEHFVAKLANEVVRVSGGAES
jgi:hypothetical protein